MVTISPLSSWRPILLNPMKSLHRMQPLHRISLPLSKGEEKEKGADGNDLHKHFFPLSIGQGCIAASHCLMVLPFPLLTQHMLEI